MAKNIIFILNPLITTIREYYKTGSVERVSILFPSLSLFFFFSSYVRRYMQIYGSFYFILTLSFFAPRGESFAKKNNSLV